jgi:ubiquinone/menaquinone biosynthesis C-methylase UbiE
LLGQIGASSVTIASVREGAVRAGPQQSFFDAWSAFYDLPVVQWATYWPVHDAIVTALRGRHAGRILDVGCGTGQLSARLARERPAARITGCDFSAGMLRHAAARTGAVDWVRGDACGLPFRDRSFDAIVSTEAFHWFPDQQRAAEELFRVLAPGGIALVALVNTPARFVADGIHAASRLAGEPFYWPTVAEMRSRFERSGFEVTAQRRIFRMPGGLLLPPVLTCAVRSAERRRHGAGGHP